MSACPAPGCGVPIAATSTCCYTHWQILPLSLRAKIRQQQNHEHNLAVQLVKAQRVWSELAPKDPS